MVPGKSKPIWTDLVTGKISHKFKSVPASMMFTRLNGLTSRDPSPKAIQKCIDDAYAFFIRYEKILTEDIQALFK